MTEHRNLEDSDGSYHGDDSDATTEDLDRPSRPARKVRGLMKPSRDTATRTAPRPMLGMTELEVETVGPAAAERYTAAVTAWLRHDLNVRVLQDVDTVVDDSVAKCLNTLYNKGLPANRGEQLVAGLEFLAPEFGRHGNRKLPRTRRCLRGWRRKIPPRSRRPLAWPIWCGIIWELIRDHHWLMAVYVLMMVVTYMRPSEPLVLLKEDLLPPRPGLSRSWIALVFRQERRERSKVYADDESVDMLNEIAPWFDTIVAALHSGNPKAPVFPFTYPQFLMKWKVAIAKLGISAVPYQARHSGASIDTALRYRTREAVKARGRWKSDASVNRYQSRARLGDVFDKMEPACQEFCQRTERLLEGLFAGTARVEDLPSPVFQPRITSRKKGGTPSSSTRTLQPPPTR